MSQAEAQNIITYVGIPLAVLGVLPTLSTTFQSLLTQRAVHRTLQENGVEALTRASLLSGIVEIEVPRLSIQPLDRNDPAYWKIRPNYSSLRGGSWSIFYWKEMVIGSKSYRLQYHDELVQPQAEIPLEALVAFLLDRGAVPCQGGLADLRSSGLWTPAGTKLLLSPTTSDAVLMIARSDDSDGILSLCLVWEPEWDRPFTGRLPPYWVRVRPGYASRRRKATIIEEKPKEEQAEINELTEKGETDTITTTAASSAEPMLPTPIRLRVSANGVEQAHSEDSSKASLSLPQFHNSNPHLAMTPSCLWFNIALTALAAPSGGLWAFTIPASHITFAHASSLPCGVLVLLGLLTDADVPAWHSNDALARIEQEEEDHEKHARFRRQSARIFDEMRMPKEEANRARQERMREEMWAHQEDARKEQVKAERKRQREIGDAIASPRLGAGVAAEAARKWLIKKEHVSEEIGATIAGVVEKCVYDMIQDEKKTVEIVDVFERWRAWTDGGGMTRANLDEIADRLEVFCYAASIVALVRDTSAHPTGAIVSDLQVCLRMWKKVRLG